MKVRLRFMDERRRFYRSDRDIHRTYTVRACWSINLDSQSQRQARCVPRKIQSVPQEKTHPIIFEDDGKDEQLRYIECEEKWEKRVGVYVKCVGPFDNRVRRRRM